MKNMKLEWKRGDWAAYFGLMTNNLTNLLTMMGLLIFVVGIPKEIVYGCIAPAFAGGAGGESLLYVVWPANGARYRTNGRHRVAVRPERAVDFYRDLHGLNAGLPANRRCGFRDSDWLVWCFVEAMILAGGSFLGETIRKMIPRTVLLSCLSGLGLLLLAMNPMLQAFEAPTVSFIVLLLIFINWFGKSRFSPVSRPACCC